MVIYLSELQRQYSCAIITQIALTPMEGDNRYSGKIAMAFPKINDNADLERIRYFAKSSPRLQQ